MEQVVTKIRNIRINDEIWDEVVLLAHRSDQTASDVVRQALVTYIHPQDQKESRRWWRKG